MNRREMMKYSSAAVTFVALTSWREQPPLKFRTIERKVVGTWVGTKFEYLKDGDVFRFTDTPGSMYTVEGVATPCRPAGNWMVQVKTLEFYDR